MAVDAFFPETNTFVYFKVEAAWLYCSWPVFKGLKQHILYSHPAFFSGNITKPHSVQVATSYQETEVIPEVN